MHQETLELSEGLNILEASNESGKSTWCAFLSAMLYGVNSRERDRAGFIADKNRYAPWTGESMQGRMDCRAEGQALTLTRETRRAALPMGAFTARYAGTGDEVPGLTGQNCGETLLGVPREVFERSAFIRQAGLVVTADAELEKRIVSLITTGEEDTSYTEASEALKRQLNRRRHNKTGQLPAAEAEQAEVLRRLQSLETLRQTLTQTRRDARTLQEAQEALERRLALRLQADAVEKRRQLSAISRQADDARQAADNLRERLDAERVPENETIARLRGAIVNLETVRKSVDKARSERDEALKARLRAETAVNQSPFAFCTPEAALRNTRQACNWKNHYTAKEISLSLLGSMLLGGGVFGLLDWLHLPDLWAILLGIGAGGGLLAVLSFYLRRWHLALQRSHLTHSYGTADPDEISALYSAYLALLSARDAAQADAAAKSATADALYASLSSNEQGILLEVRRFAPAAFDIPAADDALRQCAGQRRALSEADTAAREAALRRDILSQQLPDPTPPTASELELEPPEQSREELERSLTEGRAALAVRTSDADRLSGQIAALGDPAVLESRAQQLSREIETLSGEYASIALALEALQGANAALQSRFAPALGRRAAEIFSELTAGRYTGVVLDRSFRLSAEPAGGGIYRDAALLSAGAVDQLYLATRLAICELVLPSERAVPLILDDALANFDDARCQTALLWLRREALHRQILLFTCHTREADFFRNDPKVTLHRLTSPDAGV